jgi:hypothetical protein
MIGIEDDSDSMAGGFLGNDVDGIMKPEDVAEIIVSQALDGRFLILTHPEVATYVQRKSSDRDRWIKGMQRFRNKISQTEKART